jgi:hypothetical protein
MTHCANGFDDAQQSLHLNEYISGDCQRHTTNLQNKVDGIGDNKSNDISARVHLNQGFVLINVHLFIERKTNQIYRLTTCDTSLDILLST